MKNVFDFFVDLQANNNRDWFNENKKRYEKVKKQYEDFTNKLIKELSKFDPSIVGLSAKECLFRIYRDVRFSKDKSPYKIHFGSHLAAGGRKSLKAGYYLHYQPGGAFCGGGIHSATPQILSLLRNDILHDPDELLRIINSENFIKTFGKMKGDKLKTPPRGFPKDFEHIELLKHKQFLAIADLSDKDLVSDDLPEKLVNIFKAQKPFNDYINSVLEELDNK